MMRMAQHSSGRTGNAAVIKPDTCEKDLPTIKEVAKPQLQMKEDAKLEKHTTEAPQKRPMLRMAHPSSGRSGVEAPVAPAKEQE